MHRPPASKTPCQPADAAVPRNTTATQPSTSPAPLLTAPQALFLGALASCATMMSVYRCARLATGGHACRLCRTPTPHRAAGAGRNTLQALLIPALPLAARLPTWVVRAAMPLVGLCAYPGVLLCAAAGAAAAASWALWGLVECMIPGGALVGLWRTFVQGAAPEVVAF